MTQVGAAGDKDGLGESGGEGGMDDRSVDKGGWADRRDEGAHGDMTSGNDDNGDTSDTGDTG